MPRKLRRPKRRRDTPTRRDDLVDAVLTCGFAALDALPEDEQLDALELPIAAFDQAWLKRRSRLLTEAADRGWPRPLHWETVEARLGGRFPGLP